MARKKKSARASGVHTEMFKVTPWTCGTGYTVHFQYTHESWMPARVVRANRRRAKVKLLGGSMERELWLPWSDLRWHAPAVR